MNRIVEKLKFLLWKYSKGLLINIKYRRTLKERLRYTNILNSEQTVKYIKENRCSISRFGDGEFQMIEHGLRNGTSEDFHVDSFQNYNDVLSKRLNEVLNEPLDNLLVCIPYPLFHSNSYRGYHRIFFEREWISKGYLVKESLKKHKIMGDSIFTRFYLNRTDIMDFSEYVSSFKEIWAGENIVIVEGEMSRLGVGNDLFDNTKHIGRIICPATDAFRVYDRILDYIGQMGAGDSIFLLALGHTATVLAYDLTKLGFRALDIGHIDIEYEWFRMGAREKVPVPGKYVNEVREGRISGESIDDSEYEKQIIARIQ